ncbi:MAG: zinc ABC transporter substrate-binding protein [Burkholderiales bacterium]|nr:zinc ABC transporter substrate-binding protein [Burkholderiales bacterium]
MKKIVWLVYWFWLINLVYASVPLKDATLTSAPLTNVPFTNALSEYVPIKIVTAENFYGELSREVGGSYVEVHSIINNPNADPHLFTTSPKVNQLLQEAQIIIYNGANYDPWIEQILSSLTNKSAIIINVADLIGVNNGENPHIWYKPQTFMVLAKQLASIIIKLNPKSKLYINQNLAYLLKQNLLVLQSIQDIKLHYNGIMVGATEPVFGYMASAMGLNMQGMDLQWKIMNNTEPSPQILANFEELLTKHQVKVIFYNSQVVDAVVKNILELARQNHIPIVGISETMPSHLKVNQWLLNNISATKSALQNSGKL